MCVYLLQYKGHFNNHGQKRGPIQVFCPTSGLSGQACSL